MVYDEREIISILTKSGTSGLKMLLDMASSEEGMLYKDRKIRSARGFLRVLVEIGALYFVKVLQEYFNEADAGLKEDINIAARELMGRKYLVKLEQGISFNRFTCKGRMNRTRTIINNFARNNIGELNTGGILDRFNRAVGHTRGRIMIHDLAISTGAPFEELSGDFSNEQNVGIDGSDVALFLYIARTNSNGIAVYDSFGKPIQYISPDGALLENAELARTEIIDTQNIKTERLHKHMDAQ